MLAGVTVMLMAAVWVAEVPVPVTVTVDEPVAASSTLMRVRVELPPAVTVDGLKLAVTPLGNPEALNATL